MNEQITSRNNRIAKWCKIIGLLLTLSMIWVIIGLPVCIYFGVNMIAFTDGGLLTWTVTAINVRDLPVKLPIYLRLYLWTIDNPDDFQDGAPPRLREVGPFAFGLNSGKLEMEFPSDLFGDVMTVYVNDLGIELVEERSDMASYDQKLTMINPLTWLPVMFIESVAQHIPYSSYVTPVIYSYLKMFLVLHGEGVFAELTPRELVEGIKVSVLVTLDWLVVKPLKWLDSKIDLDQILRKIGINLPSLILEIFPKVFKLIDMHLRDNMIGIAHSLNGARVGPLMLRTGRSGVFTLGQPVMAYFLPISALYYMSKFMIDEKRCTKKNGTIVPYVPWISKEDAIHIKLPCRPPAFTYKETVSKMGAPEWRFWLGPYMQGPKQNPYNRCYCPYPDRSDLCDGVIDIGLCALWAPLAISLPHFLYAGDTLHNMVEGMAPEATIHDTYLDMNPMLDLPVDARIRLQINLITRPAFMSWGLGDVAHTVLPIAWFEVPDLPPWLTTCHHLALLAVAALEFGRYPLLVLGLLIFVMSWRTERKNRRLLLANDSTTSRGDRQLWTASQMNDPIDVVTDEEHQNVDYGPKLPYYPNVVTRIGHNGLFSSANVVENMRLPRVEN